MLPPVGGCAPLSQTFCLLLTQSTQLHKSPRGSQSEASGVGPTPALHLRLEGMVGRAHRAICACCVQPREFSFLEAESTSVLSEAGKCLSGNIQLVICSTLALPVRRHFHPGLTLKATETRAFRSLLPCEPVGPDKRSYYKGALLAAKHSPSFS